MGILASQLLRHCATSSRLIANRLRRHPTCCSFCSTHCSPACAACCTISWKQHEREPPRGPGRISKQDGVRSHSARAAIASACARPQRRSHARQRQCEWLSVNDRWWANRCRHRPPPRRALIAPKRVGPTCSSCSVVYSLLSLSLSLSCSPPPTDEVSHLQGSAACGTPGGSRAMPSPYQGTLACPKPGTPGDFSPAPDVSVDAEF